MTAKKVIIFVVGISLVFQGSVFAHPNLEVTGVVCSDKPMAIVNGEMVKEGDEIGGATVEKIGYDSVKFRYEGEIVTRDVGVRRLKPGTKKKPGAEVKSSTKETDMSSESKHGLEDLIAARERAEAELEKVKERNRQARKAIKSKIDAVRGTGLERMIDPDAWEEDEKGLW